MDPRTCDFVVPILMKRLYQSNGELPLQETIHFVRYNSPKKILNTNEDITHWLTQLNSNYFKLVRDTIIAITGVRLCKKHCSKPGSCHGDCDKLHICKFFILSNRFKCQEECRFVHDFKTPHNDKVLHAYKLQFLREEHLRCLFSKTENRHSQTLPYVCRDFNLCKCEKKNCRYLHLCKQFVIGNCPLGKKCRISHLVDSKVIAILNDYGIYFSDMPELLFKLRRMYQTCSENESSAKTDMHRAISSLDISNNDSNSKTHHKKRDKRLYKSQMNLSSPESRQINKNKVVDVKKRGICLKELSGKPCSSQECNFYHKTLPYQWQYKISSEDDWKDFDASTNYNLEEKYCDLNEEFHVCGINGFIRYDLKNMKFTNMGKNGFLRRLSTPSSLDYPNSNWTTTWNWYWKNDDDWIEYGADDPECPPLSSSEIEKKYLFNREGEIQFIHQGAICFINFKEMFQMISEKTAVLRRPVFFTNKETVLRNEKPMPSKKGKIYESRNFKKNNEGSNQSESMTEFEIIELKESDSKFHQVSEKFYDTMRAREAEILKIENIKNSELWEKYERKKKKMIKKLGNLIITNEMDLFHGTHFKNLPVISKEGFDVGLSGSQVGSRFGNGSYFTKKADYAHQFVVCDSFKEYKMLLVKVLAGLTCKGKTGISSPPPINLYNEEGGSYDSCVNDVNDPNLFVIFANDQMFPAYIITYKMPFEM